MNNNLYNLFLKYLLESEYRTIKYAVQFHYTYKAKPHYDIRIQNPDRTSQAFSFVTNKNLSEINKIKNGKLILIETTIHDKYILNVDKAIYILRDEYGGGVLAPLEWGELELLDYEKNKKIVFKSDKIVFNGVYLMINIDKNKKYNRRWILIKK